MAEPQLGYWDYVKKAFLARPQVKGLGEVPMNSLALLGVAVLGLVNPGFWLLGAGLEIGFLALVSHDPRFRKWAEAVHRAERAGDQGARKEALLGGLSKARQNRYHALEGSCRGMVEGAGVAANPLDQQTLDGVNRLLWIFLKLLASSQVLEAHLDPREREKLAREIGVYERQHEEASQDPARERVAKSLASTLDLARKRLANLDQAWEHGQFIQAELHRIEQQVALMLQEATLAWESGALSDRVDSVMETFTQTQDWMKANSEILGPMEDVFEAPPPIFQSTTA